MMPKISKGTHVFRPGPAQAVNTSQAGSASADGKLTPPLNLSQLSISANNDITTNPIHSVTAATPSPSGLRPQAAYPSTTTVNPEAISPSAPSTFLGSNASSAPASSSGLTSISRSKCRLNDDSTSAVGSEGSSRKRMRPPSATVKAQQEGSESMAKMVHVFEGFAKTFTQNSSDPLSRSIVLLSGHEFLTESQQLDVADYLSNNPSKAIIFANFPEKTRVAWLKRTLQELNTPPPQQDEDGMECS